MDWLAVCIIFPRILKHNGWDIGTAPTHKSVASVRSNKQIRKEGSAAARDA